MAAEKRLIDANECYERAWDYTAFYHHVADMSILRDLLNDCPPVDAVPVDEICVAIFEISIENQEAVLNISICGKTNEVKVPFSKEVAEVVHGRWIEKPYLLGTTRYCSICGQNYGMPHGVFNYCPNCGAKMDGGAGNGL